VFLDDLGHAIDLRMEVVKLFSMGIDGASHALQFGTIDHGTHASDNGVIEESGAAG
jgi:hypothetical protein